MIEKIRQLLKRKIIASTAGLLLITLGIKLLGYGEKLLLAYLWGTSAMVDVYTVVITLVLSLYILFREIVEPGFLNVFLELKTKGKHRQAWELFTFIGLLIITISIAISAFIMVFDQATIRFLAPGFDDEKVTMAASLLKVAIPATVFLNLSVLTNIALNGLKRFVTPASGEFIFKGAIILALLISFKFLGIIGIGIGMLLGAIGKLVLHLKIIFKEMRPKHFGWKTKHAGSMWLLTWPLVIGVLFSQASGIIDNVFASKLMEGTISALSFAKKIIEMPVLLFPYILSIVVFPYFAEMSKKGELEKQRELLIGSIKWIIIVFIPLSFFFVINNESVIRLIFERGAFDSSSTQLTSKPMAIYAIGLIFLAIETILVIFYYGNADMKTPIVTGIACVLLNITLTIVLIGPLGYIAIPLAFIIQKTVKNITLLLILQWKGVIALHQLKNTFVKSMIASAVAGIVMIGMQQYQWHVITGHGFFAQAINLGSVFLSACIIYYGVLKLTHLRFPVVSYS
ncbi:MAG: lipid II flippase MurJ [Cytophagales bacterium]|nr:lipid II flippase MurJ [Cytophagales bacterium]